MKHLSYHYSKYFTSCLSRWLTRITGQNQKTIERPWTLGIGILSMHNHGPDLVCLDSVDQPPHVISWSISLWCMDAGNRQYFSIDSAQFLQILFPHLLIIYMMALCWLDVIDPVIYRILNRPCILLLSSHSNFIYEHICYCV